MHGREIDIAQIFQNVSSHRVVRYVGQVMTEEK